MSTSDMSRECAVGQAGAATSVAAAGTTIRTGWIDTQGEKTVGFWTFRAVGESNASISYQFALEENDSTVGNGNVVAAANLEGSPDVGADNDIDVSAGSKLDHALTYIPNRRYVRARVAAANSTNASINVEFCAVGLAKSQIVPDSRIDA